jgi:hypothetical protein
MSSGKSEPSAELNPITRVFAIETPSRSTLLPKQIAPKPHANPNAIADQTALAGEAVRMARQWAPLPNTKPHGISTHATRMKTNQMFSHFHLDSSFIGAVNRPLQMPDNVARRIPITAMRNTRTA